MQPLPTRYSCFVHASRATPAAQHCQLPLITLHSSTPSSLPSLVGTWRDWHPSPIAWVPAAPANGNNGGDWECPRQEEPRCPLHVPRSSPVSSSWRLSLPSPPSLFTLARPHPIVPASFPSKQVPVSRSSPSFLSIIPFNSPPPRSSLQTPSCRGFPRYQQAIPSFDHNLLIGCPLCTTADIDRRARRRL